ncbi:MAG: polysaccharide pyruvyl transferase family protein [Algoriphagus sp.]|uniref:polysaccharide pyruvyl transferase family protein n=1 Tax=Algoriphagus sp. TaxID=1872435 RepID=UPI0017D9158C|nr:polysaccharide pyruvyl transferase family protein [Algoriphagus sp.]NVJ86746.1 polysaccharide pyruvyl transferase family protein [Algoriphagus sp.]
MRILHTYCLNYNIGDYALGIGVKNLLRRNLDVTLIGNTNLQGREFTPYYIREVVNKRYDLLVIGGGGIIHGAHWPNGWFWLIEKELIKEIKIPFIVYGVGYNYWKEEGGIPERGIVHLEETMKRAAYFSVRNDGSQNRLAEQFGRSVPAIPDPGFHVDWGLEYSRKVDEPYILIQLANDKPERRFGSLEKRGDFVRQMREVTEFLSKRYKVIFSPHVPEDISLSHEVANGISNAEVWDFGYFAFDHSDEAVGYYKHAEFVLAMRGHGQIVPIAFNTPVISLENHPKHRGLMENLGLIDYNVSLAQDDFRGELMERIHSLESNYFSLKAKYSTINQQLRLDTDAAWTEIKSNIGK